MRQQKKKGTPRYTGQKKETPTKSVRAIKESQGIPLIVVYWAFGLSVMSYIVSRFVFSTHPLHWASAIGGLLLGVVIGYLWFFIRGDVWKPQRSLSLGERVFV